LYSIKEEEEEEKCSYHVVISTVTHDLCSSSCTNW